MRSEQIEGEKGCRRGIYIYKGDGRDRRGGMAIAQWTGGG